MTKSKKRRGSSKAGRPRKDGARFPGGKLKPVGPNEEVVARRRELCADITMASCPLDTAYANGWISEADHRAGVSFAGLYRRARLGSPGMAGGADVETQTGSEVEDRPFAHMTDEEVAAVWNAAFRHVPTEGEVDQRDMRAADAMRRWGLVNAAMPPAVRAEMYRVCIEDSWPQWINQRAVARSIEERAKGEERELTPAEAHRVEFLKNTHWEAKRALLLEGCKIVREVTGGKSADKAQADERIVPVPPPRQGARGRVREETTHYVTPDGEPVLEVVRRVRERG